MRKRKRRQRHGETAATNREVRGKLDEDEREEERLAKQRKRMAVLRNDHTRRSSNSFNERYAMPFSILQFQGSHFRSAWTTYRPTQKHVPRLHVGSKVIHAWDKWARARL